MEHRRRASDCGPPCDSAERGLDPSASVVLTIEDASRDADSARLGEEKAEKSRVILGIGAILPVRQRRGAVPSRSLSGRAPQAAREQGPLASGRQGSLGGRAPLY